jgi:AcrR family transcriptional regulator
MARVFRQQIDQGILDRAAALFARYGFTQTSVQAVADAIGISKAGLLHYFPTKEALREAVQAQSASMQREVVDQVAEVPLGAARDRLAIEMLVDQALSRPGLVAFSLSFVAEQNADFLTVDDAGPHAKILEAFGAGGGSDPERLLRVIGALAALSVLALIVHHAGKSTAWRSHVVTTCFDALGYARSASALPPLQTT